MKNETWRRIGSSVAAAMLSYLLLNIIADQMALFWKIIITCAVGIFAFWGGRGGRHQIVKDIIVPVVLVVLGFYTTSATTKTQNRIAILSIVSDKINGNNEERRLSLMPLQMIDEEEAGKFKEIGDKLSIERNMRNFYSDDAKTRVTAIDELVEIYKNYPALMIDRLATYMPEDKDRWPPVISITQFLYKIGKWQCTEEQYRLFETLRSSKYYGMQDRNVRKFLDTALTNCTIRNR